jgi:hypothetical protein
LIFEHFPLWLLFLDLMYCQQAYITQFSCLRVLRQWVVSLGFNGDLFDSLVNRVGFSRLVLASLTVLDVTMVSGSLHYLVDKLRVQTGRVLGVLEHHFSGRVRNGRPAGIGVL